MLRIDDPGYQDFRSDAKCIVRPQSLIGEKFVECEPTQKRARRRGGAGRAARDRGGSRRGPAAAAGREHGALRRPRPDQQRHARALSRAPLDHRQRARHRPGRPRRGPQRRDPARQPGAQGGRRAAAACWPSRTTSSRASPSTATRSWSRWRASASTSPPSIENMSAVAEATAERRADLEANFERLPTFLRELRPTMTRLGALADEMTPVLSDLGDVAPDINRFLLELGPFSQAGIPALDSLGEAGEDRHAGGAQLGAGRARPAASSRAPRGRSARRSPTCSSRSSATTASSALMDYIFFQAAAVNGFDSFGHYLRAGLIVNQCSSYAVDPIGRLLGELPQRRIHDRRGRRVDAARPGARMRPRGCCSGLDPRKPAGRSRKGGKRGGSAAASSAGTASASDGSGGRSGGGGAAPAPAATPAPGAAQPAPAPVARRPPSPRPRARRRRLRATTTRRAAARLPVRRRGLMRGARQRHRRQPRADRRGDRARRARRGLPLLQREPGPAVRADLRAEGADAERGQPGARQRGADRRRAGRLGRHDHGRAAQKDGTSVAVLGLKLERAVSPLPKDTDGADPPALGARTEVRRADARNLGRGLRGRRHDPARAGDAGARRVRRVREHVRRGHARRVADQPARVRRRVRGPRAEHQPGDRGAAAAAARHRPGRCATSPARRRTCRASSPSWPTRRASWPPSPRRRRELFVNLDITFGALREVARPFIQESISNGPESLDAGIRGFPVQRPFLANTEGLFRELRPGVRALRGAAPDLADALEIGTPTLLPAAAVQQPPRLAADRARALRAGPARAARDPQPDRDDADAEPDAAVPRAGADRLQLRRALVPQHRVAAVRGRRQRHLAALHHRRDPAGAEQRGRPVLGAGGRPERREPPAHQPVPEHRGARASRASARRPTSPTSRARPSRRTCRGTQQATTEATP